MIYKNIGNDKVSAIGFGSGFHLPENEEGSNLERTLFTCIDNGVNFVDTAPVYGNGISERLLGSALKNVSRDKVFLASKVSPDDTTYDGVIKSAEDSLQRLQTDRIDLFQVHWPNPNVPISETMKAMETLVQQGKIRNIGVSNFLLEETKTAMSSLLSNSLASLQVEYNFFERSVEEETLPFCKNSDVKLIAYSPLAQGKLVNGSDQHEFLLKLSEKYNCTPGQLVLRWLIENQNVIAIPNTSKPSRALENAGAANISLTENDFDLMSGKLNTPPRHINTKQIRVSNDYNRKVYQTIEEAKENAMGMTPSPIELSEEMKQGIFLKPIRLKAVSETEFDLIEGRLRFWAWVIAFGWNKEIPALVWEN